MVLGKIYKIVNSVDNLIYIGSTKQPLSKRMSHHRDTFKKHPTWKLYAHFALHGVENFRIVLLENFEYTTKDQLLAREDHYIQLNDTIKNGLNGRGSFQTVEQYKQYQKAYSQTEKYKQYKKQYNQEYMKNQYRQTESTKQHRKQFVICNCGKSGLITHKSRHIKTKQHIQFQSLVEFIQN